MKIQRSLLFTMTLCLVATPAFSYGEELVGKVIGIVDGDTITVRAGKTVERVRLLGIDCPERFLFDPRKSQPVAEAAIEFTQSCYGKEVVLYGLQRDRLNRLLAEVVVVGETKSLNEQLLEKGLAWWYERYWPENKKYRELEEQARQQGLGIWKKDENPNPEPPWEFRVKDRKALYEKWQNRQSKTKKPTIKNAVPIE